VSPSSSAAPETIVAASVDEHEALAAELLARAIDAAVRERLGARVALSGGTTPLGAYRRLAALDLPWDRVEWFWVDERAVAPDDERSNFRNVSEALGRAASGRVSRVHRMEADAPDRAAAALRYERSLRESFGVASAVAFDALTLGVGDDGHTASLFPGTGAVAIDDRLVAAIDAQPARSLEARLTLTAPVIRQARLVVVLARGASKRAVVEAARAAGDGDDVPARLVQRCRGRVVWLLDEAAAGSPHSGRGAC
jgi:6-phosphogluconolactonase